MEDKVWFVEQSTGNLVSAYKKHQESRWIEEASPITVTLERLVVAKDFDGFLRGDNDLFVVSRSEGGKDHPKVERIHIYEENVPVNHHLANLEHSTMFIAEDYNGSDKLWLELHVVEVDKDLGDRQAAVDAFSKFAATAGAVFPAALPYAFGASAVVSLTNYLIGFLEENEDVMRVPFSLHPGDPMPGKGVLQTGTYVAFRGPQDGTRFQMMDNGALDNSSGILDGITYAVFNVSDKKGFAPEHVVSQKLATLLSQMKQDKDKPMPAVEAIKFLTDTLTKYDQFNKLNRYLELKEKGAALSDKEKKLMEDIAGIDALKNFLPKGE